MDKPPILGVVERGEPVKLISMADVAAKMVLHCLFKNFHLEDVEVLIVEDYPSYSWLRSLNCHETVSHSIGEYARGWAYTNIMEVEFSVFRPRNATFRGTSKESLHLYATQYNHICGNRRINRV